jgi:hypothetical protein
MAEKRGYGIGLQVFEDFFGKYYELARLHGTISGILRDHEQKWNMPVLFQSGYLTIKD